MALKPFTNPDALITYLGLVAANCGEDCIGDQKNNLNLSDNIQFVATHPCLDPLRIVPDAPIETFQADYSTIEIVDSGDPNLKYIGSVAMGSGNDTSSAIWRILREDTTTGKAYFWANGSNSFTNIWDDRESLSYS